MVLRALRTWSRSERRLLLHDIRESRIAIKNRTSSRKSPAPSPTSPNSRDVMGLTGVHQPGRCQIPSMKFTRRSPNEFRVDPSGPQKHLAALVLSYAATIGIAYHPDDWSPKSGHEWPYWHHQMWEYVGARF